MSTESSTINPEIDHDETWTVRNLAIVALILIVYPALMFAASAIVWPGGEEEPGVEVAPAGLVEKASPATQVEVSGLAPSSSGRPTTDYHAGACPHVQEGVRGGCCGSSSTEKGCAGHAD